MCINPGHQQNRNFLLRSPEPFGVPSCHSRRELFGVEELRDFCPWKLTGEDAPPLRASVQLILECIEYQGPEKNVWFSLQGFVAGGGDEGPWLSGGMGCRRLSSWSASMKLRTEVQMFDFIGFLGCNAPSFFMLFHSLLIDSFEGSRLVIFFGQGTTAITCYNSHHHPSPYAKGVFFLCVFAGLIGKPAEFLFGELGVSAGRLQSLKVDPLDFSSMDPGGGRKNWVIFEPDFWPPCN